MSTKLATKSITYLNIVIALFILSFALPVGDIYNIPLQNCFLFAFLLLSIFILVQQGKLRDILKNSISEITIFSIGLVWCIISCYFKGNALSIKFFMLLCITITVFLLFSYLTKYHLLDASYVMKSILLMMLLKMLGKFIIELLFIFKFIEYEEIMPLYSTVFHTNAITMTMHFGNLTLARIQTSSDLIVISLIPFFWVLPELSKKIRFTLFVLSGAYAFIVFSRIALAQFGCCAIITLIFYWKTFPKKWKWSGVFAAALSSILWLPSLISMIQFRFFSSFAVESDSTRNIQSAKLIEGISQNHFSVMEWEVLYLIT